MPFNLHPSGFQSWSSDKSLINLVAGSACPVCSRIAGHFYSCPLFNLDNQSATSSRGKLFDAVAVLWAKNKDKSFFTFTLPSIWDGTYQLDIQCPVTGDIAIGYKFSKLLEAWKVKEKRRGVILSYVWVSEAQMKRQEKFGGIGDIHYHLVVNRQFKDHTKGRMVNGRMVYPFVDDEAKKLFTWIQSLWCKHVGADANNCVHVDPLPDDVKSIPAYLTKYLGKGQGRAIISRRFQATQDLTKYQTIQLERCPEGLTLIREKVFTTPEGFDVVTRYYETREVLELYGEAMHDAGLINKQAGDSPARLRRMMAVLMDAQHRERG